MSAEAIVGRPARRAPNYRLRSYLVEAASIVLGIVLVIRSVTPIYNMVMVALERHGDVFTSRIWPAHPSLESFWIVVTQGYWYLENFWHQFGNSVYMGAMTVLFTLLIGSLTSFAIGRMRIRQGWLLSNAALLTYVIPARSWRFRSIGSWRSTVWRTICGR